MQSSLRKANLRQNHLDIAAELQACDSVGTGGRALQESSVCLHVVINKSSFRLTDLRKVMGRNSTKLNKNLTEKHYVLVHTQENHAKCCAIIISFVSHDSLVR